MQNRSDNCEWKIAPAIAIKRLNFSGRPPRPNRDPWKDVETAGPQARGYGGFYGCAAPTSPPAGLQGVTTGTQEQINAAWFSDAQNGFTATDNGGVRVTTNGGQTWTTSATGVTSNINAIRQVGGVAFLAGANGVICRSTNNGATWTAQTAGT